MTALGQINSATDMPGNVRAMPIVQYSAPTTGSTINVGTTGNIKLLINPAGAILALTITLPSTPTDGDQLSIASSQAVTTLTMNGGTIIGPLTSLAAATFANYIYSSTTTSWFRIG